MLCQRDTTRSWSQCANCLLLDCSVQTLDQTQITTRAASQSETSSSLFSFRRALYCFNQGPCRACFLLFLPRCPPCSQSFPCRHPFPEIPPLHWRARSALRAPPLLEAQLWVWAWSQWGYRRRRAPENKGLAIISPRLWLSRVEFLQL